MTNYKKQAEHERIGWFRLGIYIGEWVGISLVIGYCFYDALIAGVFICLLFPVYAKERKKGFIKKKKDKIALQFKDAINSVSVCLLAGYSIENAFRQAGIEMNELYGKKSEVTSFFTNIERQLGLNKNIEEVIHEYAMKWDIEEIKAFSDIFSYAKRTGGNMVEIISDTVFTISQKIETSREISVIISSKQFEQYIMDAVPIFIIFYLRLSSPELIESVYGNITGQIFMSIALAVYALSVLVSMRITDIKV